jgi:hypothetical protein
VSQRRRHYPGIIRGSTIALTEIAVALRVGRREVDLKPVERLAEINAGHELADIIQRLKKVADALEA